MSSTINQSGTICISLKEFNRLLSDSMKLAALEAAGVDNWEGYSEALSSIEEDDDDADTDE